MVTTCVRNVCCGVFVCAPPLTVTARISLSDDDRHIELNLLYHLPRSRIEIHFPVGSAFREQPDTHLPSSLADLEQAYSSSPMPDTVEPGINLIDKMLGQDVLIASVSLSLIDYPCLFTCLVDVPLLA